MPAYSYRHLFEQTPATTRYPQTPTIQEHGAGPRTLVRVLRRRPQLRGRELAVGDPARAVCELAVCCGAVVGCVCVCVSWGNIHTGIRSGAGYDWQGRSPANQTQVERYMVFAFTTTRCRANCRRHVDSVDGTPHNSTGQLHGGHGDKFGISWRARGQTAAELRCGTLVALGRTCCRLCILCYFHC